MEIICRRARSLSADNDTDRSEFLSSPVWRGGCRLRPDKPRETLRECVAWRQARPWQERDMSRLKRVRGRTLYGCGIAVSCCSKRRKVPSTDGNFSVETERNDSAFGKHPEDAPVRRSAGLCVRMGGACALRSACCIDCRDKSIRMNVGSARSRHLSLERNRGNLLKISRRGFG